MLVAIIATLATLVVLAIVVVIVFAVRSRTKSSNVGIKKEVRSINSVGVSSTLRDAGGRAGGMAGSRSGAAQRPAINPADGLKSRFVAMGVLAAAVFGSITAKLWSMQVISSGVYASAAEENQYTTVSVPAPRGYILDADGLPLVKNRLSLTVLADPEVADDHDVLQRLSAVLGIPHNVVRQRAQDTVSGAQSQRVVASDARMRDVAFISEHSDAFPGVTVQERTVRDYPYGALAAHVVGYTGAISTEALAAIPEWRDVTFGDDVGQAGVEASYDSLLAGDHGQRKMVADAEGNVVEVVSETQPTKGSDVYLTIEGPVQYVCDRALATLVAPENSTIGTGKGVGAAVVVMDVRDGGIVAMASYPTFSPEMFIGGITQDVYGVYLSDNAHDPLLNRAIGGLYPAASTYKPFTGLAALANGFADTKRKWECGGSWDGWNTGFPQLCWNHAGHGELDFRGGIVNSCDVVFYDIAKQFWDACPLSGNTNPTVGDTALQDYLSRFRFDQTTGIDLVGESAGRIPTPEWKAGFFKDYPEDAGWKGGDMTNMIIGQGYVLVTPLEIAVAYGAIATGKVMKPHLLKEVRNASGDVVISNEGETVAEPELDVAHIAMIREALGGVATENADIASVLTRFGIDPAGVACKTGTAEYTDKGDTAWFTCYAPREDPKYVVVCVVEHGGGGSAVGAPLGAEVLAATLAYDAGALTEVGTIAGSSGKSEEGAETAALSGRTD